MGLQQFQSLIHLATYGSICRTAEVMHLSPAAVHKQLKALQTELGIRLYYRKARRLVLTEEAEVLLPYWLNMIGQYRTGLAALEEWKGLRRGLIRVGAGPTIASDILPRLLKQFCAKYPRIDFSVLTGSTDWLTNGLANGALDVAVLLEPKPEVESHLAIHVIWEFEIVLVAGSDESPERCSFRDLADAPFILFQTGSRIQESIDRYFQQIRFVPRVTMRFDHAEAINALVRSGFGLSMVPAWTTAREGMDRTLRILRQREPRLFSTMVVATAKGAYRGRAVDAFIREVTAFNTADLLIQPAKKARR